MISDDQIVMVRAPRLTLWERLYLPQVLAGLAVTLKHVFRRKVTVQYPEKRRQACVSRYRGVHRLNRDAQGRVKCVACFLCPTICPAKCIHVVGGPAPWPDREKYPVRFDIDELRCIFCGMCEEVCPVDAIELTPIYDMVGLSRAEMVFDKEKLLHIHDKTRQDKPPKAPRIVGYCIGDIGDHTVAGPGVTPQTPPLPPHSPSRGAIP